MATFELLGDCIDASGELKCSQGHSVLPSPYTDTFNIHTETNLPLGDLSIVVPSFDKYSGLWGAMFALLFKHWPELKTTHKDLPVLLMSNYVVFSDTRVVNIQVGEGVSWSDDFIKFLNHVKTKYTLILLDDYMINARVNYKRLAELLDFMVNTGGVYTEITLDSTLEDGPEVNYGAIKRAQNGSYRTSLQACIWDTKTLMSLLRSGESAWDFELSGTRRSWDVDKPFYLVNKDPVFTYYNAVSRGKCAIEAIEYMDTQGVTFSPESLPCSNRDMYLDDLTIGVVSNDKHSALWSPMFTLLFKYWPKLKSICRHIPILLTSNGMKFSDSRVISINIGNIDRSWSDNFIEFLRHVKTKYILLLLGDYMVNAPVDHIRLVQVLKLMEDTNAAYTEMALDPVLIDGAEVASGLILRQQTGAYRASLQACVWNVKVLESLLKPGEGLWDFEIGASQRSMAISQNFYLISERPVFRYYDMSASRGGCSTDAISYLKDQGVALYAVLHLCGNISRL